MTSALEYERNMDSNWFVSLKGGYEFNKKYNVHNINKLNTDLFLPVECGDYAKIYSKCKVHA